MKEPLIYGNTLEYWKANAEEDYLKVPISVLKYIMILEKQTNQRVIEELELAKKDAEKEDERMNTIVRNGNDGKPYEFEYSESQGKAAKEAWHAYEETMLGLSPEGMVGEDDV